MIPGLGFSKTYRNLTLTNRILVFLGFRSVWEIPLCQLSYPSKICSNTASTQSRLSLSNDTILDMVDRTVLYKLFNDRPEMVRARFCWNMVRSTMFLETKFLSSQFITVSERTSQETIAAVFC